jgi:putative transposase
MRKPRFNDEQTVGILQVAERGAAASETIRGHGRSRETTSRRRRKYGGLPASIATRLRALKEANGCRSRVVADQARHSRFSRSS